MPQKIIYADNAATTAVSRSVLEAMLPFFTEDFGNASAVYKTGRNAARAVLKAREAAAAALGGNTEPREIFFTSGGTESDNWAVKGAAQLGAAVRTAFVQKRHIVTTAVEHHAVLKSCAALEKQGFTVTYLPPDEFGRITAEQVASAIPPATCLVSVMTANNEVGTVMPVAEIGAVCRERGVLFHTDAVQAVGQIPVDVDKMNIDLLSLSGHKLHAPKGIGALYVRKGIELPPFMDGGSQERGRRAGTENVPAIVGLGRALTDAVSDLSERAERLTALRDELIRGLLAIPETRLNGSPTNRLPGNVNISVRGIEGESLLLMLDMKGICASSGSACASGSGEPSHVLLACGLPRELAQSSLRLTIGGDTSAEDVAAIVVAVSESVEKLRSLSPYWQRINK